MGIISRNVLLFFFPPVSYPHLGWKIPASQNGIKLPSLQTQLTSVSYSAFRYLSNSILLLKPEPRIILSPRSSTSTQSPRATGSTWSQFVPLHLLCYPLVQSWTIWYPPTVYSLPILPSFNQLLARVNLAIWSLHLIPIYSIM